jgi:hypothetical protein
MDEMTAGPVGAEATGVEGPAKFGLVLRVTTKISQLVVPMCELTFVAILAGACFFEGPAKLGLVVG